MKESLRGCYAKTQSWFNDGKVQLAVKEFLASAGEVCSPEAVSCFSANW